MTDVVLSRTKGGCFRSLSASGHAGSALRGSNVACAALSMLLRTALDVLEHTDGIVVDSDVPARGELSFRVRTDGAGRTDALEARLVCAGDFLDLGLSALERDYPSDVRVTRLVSGADGS